MWRWLSLLFRERRLRAAALDPRTAKSLVDAVVAASTETDTRQAADRALSFLSDQSTLLRSQANGYPRRPIEADVWRNGAGLTSACDALADALQRRGLVEDEEKASALAVVCACAVMGHYPEQIFPRVVRRARCLESVGRAARAADGYAAVVKDFEVLGLSEQYLDEGDDDELPGEGRVILEALATSISRLKVLAPERVTPGLAERATSRLLGKV
jgi:hypothetical protein